MQSLLLRHLLGRGVFDALLPEPLWKRLWEPTLAPLGAAPPAQFGGMLSCLITTPFTVLPTAVPLSQQPRPSAGEKETTGCRSGACAMIFRVCWVRGCEEMWWGRRHCLYINIGSGFNLCSQDWDKAWSRCAPRACLSWIDACWNVCQTWE